MFFPSFFLQALVECVLFVSSVERERLREQARQSRAQMSSQVDEQDEHLFGDGPVRVSERLLTGKFAVVHFIHQNLRLFKDDDSFFTKP